MTTPDELLMEDPELYGLVVEARGTGGVEGFCREYDRKRERIARMNATPKEIARLDAIAKQEQSNE